MGVLPSKEERENYSKTISENYEYIMSKIGILVVVGSTTTFLYFFRNEVGNYYTKYWSFEIINISV